MHNATAAALHLAAQYRHPFEALLSALVVSGIHLCYADLPDCVSGLLRVRRGVVTIGVNLNHPVTRQRFTVAHEYYHYLAGHGPGLSLCCGPERLLPEELEANTFAATLLMPTHRVMHILASGGHAAQVAAELEVSMEAARKRVREVSRQ